MTVARLGKTLGLNVPRMCWARPRGDRENALAARCQLWRTEGYLRSTLYAAIPKWFSQQRFFSRYEFRAEQKVPAPGAS